MKKLIAELLMLTAPKEKEELIIYLTVAKEAISAVLMTERGDKTQENGTKRKAHEVKPRCNTNTSHTSPKCTNSHNGSVPRPAQAAHACSYSEFLKCKPLDFKGTEGVVGLTRWFEKMESVFSISNCTISCQVKFTTCTLQDDALTWWNTHVKTTTPEIAHAIPWATLKKMMTDKYCPRGEIKKIET
ncbi:hypothetical protein Tco_0944967, partial [Tanacetum coccineum]